jgi:HlyD family type I secretion membrane fusion protein
VATARAYAAFLPDAEAVIERAHSPLAAVLIVLIALMVGSLIGWAAVAEVDRVVQAIGQVEPAARVKMVNHPNGGRVAILHVAEGQRVRAGAPLITLDGSAAETGLRELENDWRAKLAQVARLEAEVTGGAPIFSEDLKTTRPDLVAEQQALLVERREAYAGRHAALEQIALRRAGEIGSIAAERDRLQRSRSLLAEQVEAVRHLTERGLYPRLRLIELDRQLADLDGQLATAAQRLDAAKAAKAEAESRRDGFEREWRSTLLAELAATNAERRQRIEALKRQRTQVRHLIVRAPVDGIVQDLQVTGAGQSVGSNQPLMKIVPTGGGLVVEARLANRDMGHVRVGQPARVKVKAYDFLHYGVLEGEVARIGADATPDPATGRPAFEVRIETEGSTLTGAGQPVEVVPGMAVEVDLLAGERTILSYLTDRLLRLKEGAFREG